MWKTSFQLFFTSKFYVSARESTLMPFSDGSGLSIFCRLMEKRLSVNNDLDGEVLFVYLSQHILVQKIRIR